MNAPSTRPAPCRSALRRVGLTVALLAAWASLGSGFAAEITRKNYRLPAGEALESLTRFAEQSGEQVIYLLNQVKGVRTKPVFGRYSAREAIKLLVTDTVLSVVEDRQTGAFMIQRAAEPPPSDTAAAKSTEPLARPGNAPFSR